MLRERIRRNFERRIEADPELAHEVSCEIIAVDELELACIHDQLVADVKVVDCVELFFIRRRSRNSVATDYRT